MESVSQKTVKKAIEAPTTAQVAIIDGSELKPRFQAYNRNNPYSGRSDYRTVPSKGSNM